MALWGEPLAEDTYADWARGAAGAAAPGPGGGVRGRGGARRLALGDHVAAAGWAADAVAAEPLRESGVLLLARALAAAATRPVRWPCWTGLRARLADELGVDPSAEVARTAAALLRGEVPAGTGRRWRCPRPTSPRRCFEISPFVGRDDELTRMREAMAGVRGRDVGRGRRGGEVAAARRGRAGFDDCRCIAARAFLPERAEAWGLARSLLREALAVDAAVAGRCHPASAMRSAACCPSSATGPDAPPGRGEPPGAAAGRRAAGSGGGDR